MSETFLNDKNGARIISDNAEETEATSSVNTEMVKLDKFIRVNDELESLVLCDCDSSEVQENYEMEDTFLSIISDDDHDPSIGDDRLNSTSINDGNYCTPPVSPNLSNHENRVKTHQEPLGNDQFDNCSVELPIDAYCAFPVEELPEVNYSCSSPMEPEKKWQFDAGPINALHDDNAFPVEKLPEVNCSYSPPMEPEKKWQFDAGPINVLHDDNAFPVQKLPEVNCSYSPPMEPEKKWQFDAGPIELSNDNDVFPVEKLPEVNSPIFAAIPLDWTCSPPLKSQKNNWQYNLMKGSSPICAFEERCKLTSLHSSLNEAQDCTDNSQRESIHTTTMRLENLSDLLLSVMESHREVLDNQNIMLKSQTDAINRIAAAIEEQTKIISSMRGE